MLLGGKRGHLQALRDSGRGLDITGLCSRCEMQLEPLEYTDPHARAGGGAGICGRCHRVQRELRCVYCAEPVDALYPPCLGCGCVSHEQCLAEWHALGETTCPAGDECRCVDEAASGHVESWTAMRAALAAADRLRTRADDDYNHSLHFKTNKAGLIGRAAPPPLRPRQDTAGPESARRWW